MEELQDINILTDDQISDETEKAKESGKKIFILTAEGDDDRIFQGVFQKPPVHIFQKYLDDTSGKKDKGDGHVRASQSFVMAAIILPIPEDYFAMVKEVPALNISLANDLAKGYGMSRVSKKKLT